MKKIDEAFGIILISILCSTGIGIFLFMMLVGFAERTPHGSTIRWIFGVCHFVSAATLIWFGAKEGRALKLKRRLFRGGDPYIWTGLVVLLFTYLITIPK